MASDTGSNSSSPRNAPARITSSHLPPTSSSSRTYSQDSSPLEEKIITGSAASSSDKHGFAGFTMRRLRDQSSLSSITREYSSRDRDSSMAIRSPRPSSSSFHQSTGALPPLSALRPPPSASVMPPPFMSSSSAFCRWGSAQSRAGVRGVEHWGDIGI